MSFEADKRRMVPRFSEHGSLRRADLDRIVAYPTLRISREGTSIGIAWEWADEIVPDTLPPEFTWAVERSGSPGGPFRRIVEGLPGDARFFRDDNCPQGRERTQQLYYRLLLEVEGQDPLVYGFNPDHQNVSEGAYTYGVACMGDGTATDYGPAFIKAIRRRVWMLMRVAPNPGYLYREAWTEAPCAMCVNPLTGTEYGGTTTCRTCLGTGFAGGYYSPLEVEFIPMTQTRMLVSTPIGSTDLSSDHRIILPYWPPIHPRDVIRQLDGTLFTVGSVDYPDLYGVPGLQMAVLSNIDRAHPLNRVPLPDGARERARGPRRQWARAMNMSSYAKSLQDGAMHRASYFVSELYQRDDR